MGTKSKGMAIHCGKSSDSIPTLKRLVNEESEKLCKELTRHAEKSFVTEVFFWTDGLPELIGIGTFVKKDGNVTYEIDYSESTVGQNAYSFMGAFF